MDMVTGVVWSASSFFYDLLLGSVVSLKTTIHFIYLLDKVYIINSIFNFSFFFLSLDVNILRTTMDNFFNISFHFS
ncbi:hypothetical protein Scep_010080 [Stephania cephalantha]|uniref:Uncharacterized protein n=1 Tax=Stephania cephalantha TaxID=152367 RepID=A0AAP0JV27_9MAGN